MTQACERWLYSACLCYLLPVAEQPRVGFTYRWPVYQLEISRNLRFSSGRRMQEIFQSVIDGTRSALDVRTIRTLFGNKQRPFFRREGQPNFEVVVERPAYDLIVFKVHCGLLTLKISTKGERLLRIEAIVHNAKKEFSLRLRHPAFPGHCPGLAVDGRTVSRGAAKRERLLGDERDPGPTPGTLADRCLARGRD
ncbi:MAG: hypothetical protein IH899_03165 [Planctomycetes bacterium]|nr:hypothetical protein [Planctomycetota bacterium]